MFDCGAMEQVGRVLADPATPQIERLRAAVELRAIAEAAEAQAIAALADEHEWRESAAYDVVGRGPCGCGAFVAPVAGVDDGRRV